MTSTRTIRHLALWVVDSPYSWRRSVSAILPRSFTTKVNGLHALETSIGEGHRIGLTETALPADQEHAQAIAALSDKLGVGAHEVTAVFRSELDRLAAGARITNFLIVLALSKTRSVLRARTGRVAAH